MRERMKRRKKTTEPGKVEAPPAPLQPSFYDTEPASAAPAHTDPPAHELPEPEAARETASAEPEPGPLQSHGESGDALKRRRRRSRGGRGRTRSGPRSAEGVTTGGARRPGQVPPAEGAQATVAAPAMNAAVAAGDPAGPPRPSKGTVVLAIGLPGSGKSSWFKRHNITPLSSDLLRALLFDDPAEQRFQDLIFSNLRSMLKARLIARRPLNYVDATNLTSHDRHSWIKLAKDYGYDVQAVFFDVPVEVCLERNRKRERVVPEDAMRRMAGKLKPPAFEEGFSKITVVRVKQKE
jgi:predicted kinase